MTTRIKWNNVIILSIAQALFLTSIILMMTLSGMVGLKLSTNKSLATLPVAMIAVGTALMLIPASMIIKKVGQRNGFLIGTTISLMAGLLSFFGIIQNSFTIFFIGNMLLGCYQGFAQYFRFAAADSVPDEYKGKAISLVLAGGVLAAFAGPNLARYTIDLGPIPYAYSYLSIALLSILSFVVIYFLKLKTKEVNNEQHFQPRSLKVIIGKKATLSALIASSIGYAVMMMIMTATPLAMRQCGHTAEDATTVIQWHVLGMYVPSFFTGTLIRKFGTYKIIISGIFICLLHIILAMTGIDFFNFISGLILLGIGWNFMFIGGSTLLTGVYNYSEKEKVQAFHDFLIFLSVSLCSFAVGGLLKVWGWQGVNLAAIPLLFFSLLWFILLVKKRYKKGN
ncbi:MFS transporter [Sphingobacterium sp.]|uniref:MFS transporter n=1 Tax=Sphingobacterium sp. TaxID=341027 RepID=UPI002898B051|nr:MFS transporter [Sphingobacterium sp.]